MFSVIPPENFYSPQPVVQLLQTNQLARMPEPKSRSQSKTKEANNEANTDYVKLSREQLLQMSSQEYEEYVKRLAQKKPGGLTSTEMKEVKRQRRLIKNREYAQTSRIRKKILVNTIKTQLSEVETERNNLQTQVQNLTSRVKEMEDLNRMLVEENRQLRNQLQYSNPQQQQMVNHNHNHSPVAVSHSPLDSPDCYTSSEESHSQDISDTYLTFSDEQAPSSANLLDSKVESDWAFTNLNYTNFTYLFIILFSFGFLFSTSSIFAVPRPNDLPVANNVPYSTAMPWRRTTGRTLLEEDVTQHVHNIPEIVHSSSKVTRLITMEDVLMDELSVQGNSSATTKENFGMLELQVFSNNTMVAY